MPNYTITRLELNEVPHRPPPTPAERSRVREKLAEAGFSTTIQDSNGNVGELPSRTYARVVDGKPIDQVNSLAIAQAKLVWPDVGAISSSQPLHWEGLKSAKV